MRLVKLFLFNLVRPEIFSHEYFFDENLLEKKKWITVVAGLVEMEICETSIASVDTRYSTYAYQQSYVHPHYGLHNYSVAKFKPANLYVQVMDKGTKSETVTTIHLSNSRLLKG